MVNKVILVGRLGKDPELRHTPSGASVVNFSVATDKRWTDKQGERHVETQWHQIVAWGKLAEICDQYLIKGSQVFIEGEIQTRQWADKEGQKRQTTEILASQMRMLGDKSQEQHLDQETSQSSENWAV